ncbi:MAG: SIR2 family protein [Rhodocyclaceae bacterium]|nr:SIR2 family protein [Rhodocyclaceae bacterium]
MDGRTRIITTNFDRLFEEVIATKALSVERFQAPLLPVPKNRWDGLVYLHGLLTAAPDTERTESVGRLQRRLWSGLTSPSAGLLALSASCFETTPCFVGPNKRPPILR